MTRWLAAALVALCVAGVFALRRGRAPRLWAAFQPAKEWVSTSPSGLHLARPTTASYSPSLNVDLYRAGEDGIGSADAFVARYTGEAAAGEDRVSALVGVRRRAPARAPVAASPATVGGRVARRFEFSETMVEDHPSPRRRGDAGAVVVRNAYTVVPVNDGFWVLRYSAAASEFDLYRSEYERLLRAFEVD